MAKKAKGGKKRKGKQKGKKRKGQKPIVIKAVPVTEPPPPELPTYARLSELRFNGEEPFLEAVKQLDLDNPSYVLFREIQEVKCQTPEDKLSLEECIYLNFIDMLQDPNSKNTNYYIVNVESSKLRETGIFLNSDIKVRQIPTLVRWQTGARLEGNDLYDPYLLASYFKQEAEKNSRAYDISGEVCPFLPPPPPPPVEEPLALTPPVKKRKGKGKKGKGKTAKGKKGKGKGKKGKK